jgi:N-carbamoyl-L-amino-acid hydrolase
MTRLPAIDGTRLLARLDAFARIGATASGGVNRQALSPEDRAARQYLADLAIARGLAVFQDPLANLFIRRPGRDAAKPPFLIGSHLDSQPTGGRYDGALGTLAAFEVLETLEDNGIQTPAAIEAVAWTNEEGSRFAPGAMGSMAFADGKVPNEWGNIRGTDGTRLVDALSQTLNALPSAVMRPLGTPIAGYLELHIEQAPSLDRSGIPIGIVTGVQGTRWLDIRVTGQAAHAGTTQRAYRRDPVIAVTDALHMLYATIMPDDEDARFTVGRIFAEPGSVNAIPGMLGLTVDLRHPDAATLDELQACVIDTFRSCAARHGCTLDVGTTFHVVPTTFSGDVVGKAEQSAETLGLPFRHMISGAFHDALYIARIAPTAMIFVPCRDGLSHNEAEYVTPHHAIAGTQMLLQTTMAVLEG